MNVKELFGNKKALAAIIIIIGIILVIVLASSLGVSSSVSAKLEKATLSPGEETSLTVTVNNPTGRTLSNVVVEAFTADSDVFISTPSPEYDVIGIGETRVFKFAVTAVSTAADGSYVIKVRVPRLSEETNVRLEVKS